MLGISLRLRGVGEPSAHRGRIPRFGSDSGLLARFPTWACCPGVRSDGASATVSKPLGIRLRAFAKTFCPSDFVLGANGVCQLHPQLARRVARLTTDDKEVQEAVLWLVGKFRAVTSQTIPIR
jgi:hypothetical protein